MLWARYLIDPNQYLIGSTPTNYEVWQDGTLAKLDVIYKDGNSLLMTFNNTDIPEYSTDENVFSIIVNDITKGISINTTNKKIGKTSNNSDIYLKILSTYGEYTTFPSVGTIGNIYIGDSTLHNNAFLGSGNNINNISLSYSCISNTFESYTNSISFGNNCSSNLFTGSCVMINFSNACGANSFFGGCAYITMNNYCLNNILFNCYNNVFEDNCMWNVFGSGCMFITMLTSCQNNIFGSNKQNIFIKKLQSKNLIAISSLSQRNYETTIEKRLDGNFVYWSLDSNNIPQYTVIA